MHISNVIIVDNTAAVKKSLNITPEPHEGQVWHLLSGCDGSSNMNLIMKNLKLLEKKVKKAKLEKKNTNWLRIGAKGRE